MDASLRQRIITALIVGPIALACIFLLPPTGFAVFIGLVIAVAAWEWAGFACMGQPGRVAYALLVAAALAALFLYSNLPSLTLPLLVAAIVWWLLAFLLVLTYPASARLFSIHDDSTAVDSSQFSAALDNHDASAVDSSQVTAATDPQEAISESAHIASASLFSVLTLALKKALLLLIGLLVLTATWTALIDLRDNPDFITVICFLLFMVWGADIGAYFAGRRYGKAKLAPRVSPGKTWAGFFGGLLGAMIVCFLLAFWVMGQCELPGSLAGLEWHHFPLCILPGMASVLLFGSWLLIIAIAPLVATASVLGDLTISMFKRNSNIKDTSNLLPGHGGVLDRVDSLLSAFPVFALILHLA